MMVPLGGGTAGGKGTVWPGAVTMAPSLTCKAADTDMATTPANDTTRAMTLAFCTSSLNITTAKKYAKIHEVLAIEVISETVVRGRATYHKKLGTVDRTLRMAMSLKLGIGAGDILEKIRLSLCLKSENFDAE